MFVIKRDGSKESVKFDKITSRIENILKSMSNNTIDATIITQKICNRIYPGITTTELDNLASQVCMNMITDHPDYGILGSQIVISNHQKNTSDSFLEVVKKLRNNKDINGNLAPLVSEELLDIAEKYEKEINDIIDYEREYLIDFFGFKTLEKSYLLKVNKKVVERPSHLFMRVAIGIHGDDLKNVKKTYNNMSLKNYTHATPTLFNAGTPRPQLSSCFLTATEDSIEGIFETITDCAKISKWAGGIGIHISNIRANGSYIRKTGGSSDGIMPMLKVYNDTARYINQGGKRNGSFAVYIEPWHADIYSFLDAKKNHGAEEERARDLFYALWIPDLFMRSVENDENWYLMCPDKCPGLPDVYGEDFDNLYNKYVIENKYNKKIKARDLWEAIIGSQVETGTPYMLYKDAANKKSNQKNIGTIKSSNLCVSGDTMILTKEGYYQIKTLVDVEVEVWNGDEWSKTCVKKTGENQKLLTIKFSNFTEIKCTEYHKFYIEEDNNEKIYDAKNLKSGMHIMPYRTWIEDKLILYDDIYITDIQECLEKEDTFCFNEPLKHKGIFNGILLGNCAEIIEYSGSDETAVCLTADTIIFTDKGLRKITECNGENVLSFYNNDTDLIKKQQYIKAELINNGVKEVFEIDLVGGFPIKATKNHKFLVLKKRNYNKKINTYEWKTVEELTLKDRINRPKINALPVFKDVNILKDLDIESLVVGWMIGDGWQRSYIDCHKYTYGVCFGSHEVYAQTMVIDQLNKIQINLEALKYGKNKKVKTYISKNGVVNWACSKESFANYFINNYGLEPKLGKNKIISEKINKLEPFKIASILSGLFSADGTVYRKTGKKNSFYVGLSSASKQLLVDTQLLLKCFGITSCLVFTEVKSRKSFQGKLTIENRESIKLFSKHINFLLCPEKKEKLENGILNHVYSCQIDEREWMSIRSIKNVGFENVYDLSIPNSHNFIANMVTVHNCNLASICLQNVLEYPCVKDFSPSYYKWIKLLNDKENELFNILKHSAIKIFTTEDCTYCKLLKSLLKKIGLTYTEINKEEAEKLRIMSEPTFLTVKPFETVPQLFADDGNTVIHYGGYDDCWELLKPRINFMKLKNLAGDLTINLNKIIDKNFYPIEKTRVSNIRHRPIGIGVQGLADLFILLRIPFDSPQAMKLNKEIFETIYYGAMESSIKLAIENGKYSSFEGSPLSEGLFQFNLWGLKDEELSGKWDWTEKREEVMKYGARNSLLIALMPTASTSQIMNSNECFEPYTSNIYTRRTLAGEFTIVNKYLMQDLIDLDMWNEDTKDRLIYDKGSVKNIKNLPKFMKDVYKTVWEVSQKNLIMMSADRAPFVCQSQSLNLFFEQPNFKTLTSAHMIGWKNGLKTGSYYIRSKPAVSSQRFGFDAVKEKNLKEEEEGCLTCSA